MPDGSAIAPSGSESLDLSQKNFLRKAGVLRDFGKGPFCAILDGPGANFSDCMKSDFVVANIQQLAAWLPRFPPNFFDMILVDEGHHNAAPNWRKVFEQFPAAKVVSLTATPFRGDNKQVAGSIIFRYSFTRAMINGYIKQINASNLAPEEIYFVYRGEARRHTLEEVMELREEEWFSRGVALSPECNQHIVEASIKKLETLRGVNGFKHQVIAVACSVDHAKQIRALYEAYGLQAREVHSMMTDEDQGAVFAKLEQGQLDCIVQVQMLGEGFDHPPLSVAAIFRPFRSLSPYIQFVGRIMRVTIQDSPEHPDNRGFVVSHVGLNSDPLWKEFKELDLDDEKLFRRLTSGTEEDDESSPDPSNPRFRRFDGGMNVTKEVLAAAFNNQFLDPDDPRVLDQIMESIAAPLRRAGLQPQAMGITHEVLREQLKALHPKPEETPLPAMPASPQKQRQALRTRLNERVGHVAGRVLQDLGMKPGGKRVGSRMKKYGGEEDMSVAIKLVNAEIKTYLGTAMKREQLDLEQLQRAYDGLDAIGDLVVQSLRLHLEK